MRNFIDLRTIYPNEIEFGDFKIYIETRNLDTIDSVRNFYNLGYSLRKDYTMVLARISKEETLMTNHELELLTNKHFVDNAQGDVLIIGLGLGMIVYPLLEDDSVKSITIIEKEQDIINYVGSKIKKLDIHNKVNIIKSDAFAYYETQSDYARYDYIYIDFWSFFNEEAVREMEELMIKYQPFKKNEDSFLRCWAYDIKHIIL